MPAIRYAAILKNMLWPRRGCFGLFRPIRLQEIYTKLIYLEQVTALYANVPLHN
jgi:hypothetical protein